MRRFLLGLVTLALSLVGCDTTLEPPRTTPLADSLAVYAIVEAYDSSQYALVTRPRPQEEWRSRYVQDASVYIDDHPLTVVPEDSIDHLEQPPLHLPMETRRNYVTDSLPIRPGRTYRLHVVRRDQEVTGTVRVPGPFTGTADSMTVRWEPSAGAQEYTLRVRRYNDVGSVEWEYTTATRDTSAVVASSTGSGPFEPGPHEVIITAVDSNYTAYKDKEAVRSGLEGGFGLFGAVTRIGGTLTLPATHTGQDKTPLSVDGGVQRRSSPQTVLPSRLGPVE